MRHGKSPIWSAAAGVLCLLLAGVPTRAVQDQEPEVAVDPIHARLDRILDTYVRDGLVYYRALKAERRVLDNYVDALGAVTASEYADLDSGRAENLLAECVQRVRPADRRQRLPD